MSAVKGDGLAREFMVRHVASRLSPELQAEYYNMLRYCQNLPANDELLIVLNAIQILPLLTIDLPGQVAAEREKIDRLLISNAKAQENSVRVLQDYQAKLDERIAGLPQEIVKLINPEAIAALITESLRQQFDKTAIPETAKLLRSGADDVNAALVEIRSGAKTIAKHLNQAVLEGNGFLERVESKCQECLQSVSRDARHIATILKTSIGSLILIACGVSLWVGLMLGIFLHDWWGAPAQPSQPSIAQPQTPETSPQVETRPKNQVHRK